MVPLVAQPIILFVAIAVAAITLIAAAIAQSLAVVLAVTDLLCKLGHVSLHGFGACHERAAFLCPSLAWW